MDKAIWELPTYFGRKGKEHTGDDFCYRTDDATLDNQATTCKSFFERMGKNDVAMGF